MRVEASNHHQFPHQRQPMGISPLSPYTTIKLSSSSIAYHPTHFTLKSQLNCMFSLNSYEYTCQYFRKKKSCGVVIIVSSISLILYNSLIAKTICGLYKYFISNNIKDMGTQKCVIFDICSIQSSYVCFILKKIKIGHSEVASTRLHNIICSNRLSGIQVLGVQHENNQPYYFRPGIYAI